MSSHAIIPQPQCTHTHQTQWEKVTEHTIPTTLLTYFCLKLSTPCEISSSGMNYRKTHLFVLLVDIHQIILVLNQYVSQLWKLQVLFRIQTVEALYSHSWALPWVTGASFPYCPIVRRRQFNREHKKVNIRWCLNCYSNKLILLLPFAHIFWPLKRD